MVVNIGFPSLSVCVFSLFLLHRTNMCAYVLSVSVCARVYSLGFSSFIFYLFRFILALIKFIQSHIYYIIHIIIMIKLVDYGSEYAHDSYISSSVIVDNQRKQFNKYNVWCKIHDTILADAHCLQR